MSKDAKAIQQRFKQRHVQLRQAHREIFALGKRFLSAGQTKSHGSQIVKKSTSLREVARASVKETLKVSSGKPGQSRRPFGSVRGPSALGRRQVGSGPLVHRKQVLEAEKQAQEAEKQAELEQLHQALEVKLAALEVLRLNRDALYELERLLGGIGGMTGDPMLMAEIARVKAFLSEVESEIVCLMSEIERIQRQIAALSK